MDVDKPEVPERIKHLVAQCPPEYVIMPRSRCEEIMHSAEIDFEARGGYAGYVIPRERALDPCYFDHIFRSILEDGDYGLYMELHEDIDRADYAQRVVITEAES